MSVSVELSGQTVNVKVFSVTAASIYWLFSSSPSPLLFLSF